MILNGEGQLERCNFSYWIERFTWRGVMGWRGAAGEGNGSY